MDSPTAEGDDYVFLSSRSNSVTSNSRSDRSPTEDDESEPDDSELTLTRERCNSLLRRSQSWQPKQLPPERVPLKTSSLRRSRHPSDNGGACCQLFNPKKSTDDLPSGRGLRLLHRTMSLSIDGRGQRTQSMSESPSAAPNPGILAGYEASASHSSTSNLVRIRRSAKGQSAPNLCSTLRDATASLVSRRNSNRTASHMGSSSSSSSVIVSAAVASLASRTQSPKLQSPKLQSPKLQSPRTRSPRTQSPKRSAVLQAATPAAAAAAAAATAAGSPVDSSRSPSIHYLPAHLRAESRQSDARRWSLASLPSSGYGTTASESSNESSQCSSKENLNPHLHHSHLHHAQPQRTLPEQHSSSNESNPGVEEASGRSSPFRPRSRSLSSPARSPGAEQDLVLMNSVYKERFPNAQAQMEDRLQSFYSQLESLMTEERDAIARYSVRQIQELARECLLKSQNNQLSSAYFFDITQKVEVLAQECEEKSKDALARVLEWGRQLLVIVSRTARLLECLEFDPAEFLQLLEAAEGQVRQFEKLRTDIPRYIVSKLGLNKDPLDDMVEIPSESASFSDSASASDAAESKPMFSQPCEEDFEVVKLISNGAYGAVHLVRHKTSRQRFAMKKVKKTHLVLRNQVDQAFAERDILSFADNPFVVSLFCTFETKKYLCMVMEFVEAGDCASLLKQIQVLPLDLARMYFAEMVLALEYLHNYGIVHRDLKPSNLLISSEGHIKLTDFGLSKIGLMNLATNLYEAGLKECAMFKDAQIYGTPEYISPEVILRQGYGKPVDWWAAGIILYQFLVGCVPFVADSAEELFMLLVSEPAAEIEWPDGDDELPPEAVDLICRLLETNPLLRLGTGGTQEVKDHQFFAGIDWTGLLKEKSEFVPQLDHDEDTSYFDPRSDRYNHDSNSDSDELDDSDDPLFHSFGSYSPRFSQLSGGTPQTPPSSPQPQPPAAAPTASSGSPPTLQPPSRPMTMTSPSARTRADSSPPGLRRTSSLRRPPVSPLATDVSVTRSPSAHQLPAKTSTCPDTGRAPLSMCKGPYGFGFTIRAIRVYQGDTNFFLLHHLVVFVRAGSPAQDAGLRIGDLVTHVNEVSVTGLPHPEVIALILKEPQLLLRATPLSSTPIRSDGRPRGAQPGRMVRGPRQRRSRGAPSANVAGSPRQGPPTPLRYRVLKSVDSPVAAGAAAVPAGRPQSLCASQPLNIQPPQQRARASSSGSAQGTTSPRRKSVHSGVAPSPLAMSPNQGPISPQSAVPAVTQQGLPGRRPLRGRHNTSDGIGRKM